MERAPYVLPAADGERTSAIAGRWTCGRPPGASGGRASHGIAWRDCRMLHARGHLFEAHDLTRVIFNEIGTLLEGKGLLLKHGCGRPLPREPLRPFIPTTLGTLEEDQPKPFPGTRGRNSIDGRSITNRICRIDHDLSDQVLLPREPYCLFGCRPTYGENN